jgi:hypothetical protein
MTATIAATKLDPDEVRMNMREQIRYMALRNLPVARDDLFEGIDLDVTQKSRESDDLWTAEEAGYQSGRHAAPIEDNPYQAGGPLFVAWESWWHKGQAAIARELGPDGTQASTARSRPRRAKQLRLATDAPADGETTEAPEAPRRGRPVGSRNKGRRSAPQTTSGETIN